MSTRSVDGIETLILLGADGVEIGVEILGVYFLLKDVGL